MKQMTPCSCLKCLPYVIYGTVYSPKSHSTPLHTLHATPTSPNPQPTSNCETTDTNIQTLRHSRT